MIQLLAPLLTTLAANGMNLLSNAIQAKGKEFIEEKIGMKIPDNPSPEELAKLKIAEMGHEEVLLELGIKRFELEIEQTRVENENTDSARKMNASIQISAEASAVAKIAPYVLDFIIIISTIVLVGMLVYKAIPESNKELAYLALGSLLTMCGTILNFHRGSSASSHKKDDTISAMHAKGGL